MPDLVRALPPALAHALAALPDASAARRFAVACAERSDPRPTPGHAEACALARAVADGHAPAAALAVLRARLGGTACAATTVGLRHGAANAPAFLAAVACLRDDAHEAAHAAALWMLTARAFRGDRGSPDAVETAP